MSDSRKFIVTVSVVELVGGLSAQRGQTKSRQIVVGEEEMAGMPWDRRLSHCWHHVRFRAGKLAEECLKDVDAQAGWWDHRRGWVDRSPPPNRWLEGAWLIRRSR